MIRTQVYLTERQSSTLQRLARTTGKTRSELIRLAVNLLAEQFQDPAQVGLLRQAKGLWKDRDDLPSGTALRREWDRG